MPGRPWYRREYLVDRRYQLRFVTRLFLVVLVLVGRERLIRPWTWFRGTKS